MAVRGKEVTARKGRFVRLHAGGSSTQPVFLTFLGAGNALPPDHGVIAGIARENPGHADLIRKRLGELIARDLEFLSWLEQSPANSALLASDPVAAVRKALPDLPEDFFEWPKDPE